MYVHIGGEKIVRSSEIIAIFDIAIDNSSKISNQFLQHAKENKEVDYISEEEAKSIILTKHKVIYSPISSSTLKKRTHHINDL